MSEVKLDSEGKEEWVKLFGGGGYDEGFYVHEGQDGNFIIGGTSDSGDQDVFGNSGYSVWLVNISPSGELIKK